MSGDLRAGPVAGRLQRTLAMRMLRVASASVLALIAMLLWGGTELSLPRAYQDGPAVAAAQRLTSRKAAQSALVGGRHQLFVRSRAGEGDGDSASFIALASSRADLFSDVAQSSRTRLRRFALGHAPSGEPSPFDATAPPASSPRNG